MKPRSGEHIGISSLPMGKAEAVNENPFRAISENVIKNYPSFDKSFV